MAPVVLALITLAAYSNSFDLGVALDARGILQGDPRIREVSAQNLGLILHTDYWWPSSVDQLYRPLTTASFLFNYAVLGNGPNPAGYHWVNFLLHLANVWLVYLLARRLLSHHTAALFAAAIWAVHPLGTEAVTNLAGRGDLLSTMAVLGGLLLYLRIRETAGHAWALYGGLFAVATLGVMSKENAAVLVGLMALWDMAFPPAEKLEWKRRVAPYAAVLASVAVLFAARQAVFAAAPWPEMPFVDNPIRAAGLLAGRLTAVKVIGMELGLLVWPMHLSSDRAFDEIPVSGVSDWRAWLALAVVGGILAVVLRRRRRDGVIFWAAGFFGITLLPTSNLLFPIGSIMAERFLYLPSVGLAVAVAALAWRAANRQAAKVGLCVVVALLAVRTWARNPDWRNDATLNAADVTAAPGSFRLHEGLAYSLFQEDARGNLDGAIAEGEAAWNILRVLPPQQIYQQTPAHLGLYYLKKGDAAGGAGRAWYEKALAVLQAGRTASQAQERAYDDAQAQHGKPLTTRVAFQPLYFILAAVEERLGRNAEALEAARYGLELDPTRPDGYDAIAAAYRAMGDAARATVMVDAKASVLGLSPPVIAELRQAYAGEACALSGVGDAARLDVTCPRVHGDLCAAWSELDRTFTAARIPKPAETFRQQAMQNGCGVGR